MNERDAFIRGIAANLYDDTPRLAFADWLDEHGEHDRAEFIRVQCELEPIRDKYEIPRAAELHAREEHFGSRGMHQTNGARMARNMPPELGRLAVRRSSVEFRRGFPDLLRLSARRFVSDSEIRTRHAPDTPPLVVHCLQRLGRAVGRRDQRSAGCQNSNWPAGTRTTT